ncbi:MAG: hypothetical protein AB7Q76_00740 [Gammaproteobacteria bacterium]
MKREDAPGRNHQEETSVVSHSVIDRLAREAHEAVDTVNTFAAEAGAAADSGVKDARELYVRLANECATLIRTHPGKTLVCAAAAGFVLTRLLRR